MNTVRNMASDGKKKDKDLFPIVHREIPAQTALMLYRSGVLFEPNGTKAFEALKRLRKAKYDKKQVSALTRDLEPWQVERIRESIDAREKWIDIGKRNYKIINGNLDRALKESVHEGLKAPVKYITMTEKCNRGCLHCMVSANMGGKAMPFRNFERYLGLIRLHPDTIFTGAGEPFLYYDSGKDLGDAVKAMLEQCDYVSIGIVTSGISMKDENSLEARAARKLASLNEMDKERVSISLSVRNFTHRMDAARETLKFFIENGIKVAPSLEGVTLSKCDDGKARIDEQERKSVIKDLASCFGISDLYSIKSNIQCDPCFAFMGNMVANYISLIKSMKMYFSPAKLGGIIIKSWDDCSDLRKDVCERKWFGLMPDGEIVPGCCNFAFPFMRLGSLENIGQDNRESVVKQMLEDKYSFIAAQRGWRKSRSCAKCVSWFVKMEKRMGGRLGIRNPEKLISVLPTEKDIKALNRTFGGTVIRRAVNPLLNT
jgi:hypothetical protein